MSSLCFARIRILSRFRISLGLSSALAAFLSFVVPALAAAPAASVPAAPDKALIERAEKIVTTIVKDDPARAVRVRDIVARQYAELRVIHEARDAAIDAARAKAGTDKAAVDEAARLARDTALARQAELRFAFHGRLRAELNPAEIEQVKDGMTYGVVPLTFRVYNEMLPNLTAEQKAQLYAWLVEAREHAMDAGSSDEKHGWFGKYKGKINNYLAAAGINMKQAEKDLAARRKTSAENATK